jgi:hypothetical protein
MIAVTAEKLRHLPQGSEMPSMGPGRVNIREVMRVHATKHGQRLRSLAVR